MNTEQAETVLFAAYQAEVVSRQREFVSDDGIRESCKKIAEFLTSDTPKFGLMLCGICGNGKSTMLNAIQLATTFLSDCGAFDGKRESIRIVDARKIITYAWNQGDLLKGISSTSLLGIEDLGKEPTEIVSYGNVLTPMVELLEYRYDKQLFTAITTNLKAGEIRRKYGDRIADRFNEMLEVVIFGNASYRK